MSAKYLTMALLGTALISAPALAQSTEPTTPTAPRPSTTTGAPAATPSLSTSPGQAITQEQPGQWRLSQLEGLDVYNNLNEKIGDVREILIGRSGEIEAVVIGVGGFLGLGERDVAVPFDQIKFTNEPRSAGGTSPSTTGAVTPATPPAGTTGSTATTGAYRSAPDHAVLNMTKDQLMAFPEFKYNR